jgi:hypothetical protein
VRHDSLPASAATTGRTAASLRAAIALSAEVSVSTIHSHADLAPAPSANSRQWPWSCPLGALAAQAHGRTVVNLFYEDSTRPKACSTSINGFPQLDVENEGNLTPHLYADLRFSRLSTKLLHGR